MGRHCIEKKRAKRKAQQKQKQLAKKQARLVYLSDSVGSSETSHSSDSLSHSMLNSPNRVSSLDGSTGTCIHSLLSVETHTVCEENRSTRYR